VLLSISYSRRYNSQQVFWLLAHHHLPLRPSQGEILDTFSPNNQATPCPGTGPGSLRYIVCFTPNTLPLSQRLSCEVGALPLAVRPAWDGGVVGGWTLSLVDDMYKRSCVEGWCGGGSKVGRWTFDGRCYVGSGFSWPSGVDGMTWHQLSG
jgi:hypothetical protein